MGRGLVAVAVMANVLGTAAPARAQDAASGLAPPGGPVVVPVTPAPGTPPPPVYATPGLARVTVAANMLGVTFHVLEPDRRDVVLCTAPCAVGMPLGTYRLALSRGNGGVLVAPELLTVQGNTQIVGSFQSHNGLRIGGAITLGVGLAEALVDVLLGALESGAVGSDVANIYYGTGAVVGGIALIVGLILLTIGDSANIQAAPG